MLAENTVLDTESLVAAILCQSSVLQAIRPSLMQLCKQIQTAVPALCTGWWQTLLAMLRLHSMLHLALFLMATSLMFVSTAAAICALALSARCIIAFCFAPLENTDAESGATRTAQVAEVHAKFGAQSLHLAFGSRSDHPLCCCGTQRPCRATAGSKRGRTHSLI